jgi:thymidylate synthase
MGNNIIEIQARDLYDAWFQCIYKVIDEGNVFKIDEGSYAGSERLEFDHITVQIKYPGSRPLLPKISERWAIPDPVEEGYLNDYLPYLMTGELKEGESYTYGQRICNYPIPPIKDMSTKGIYIDDSEIWNNDKIISIEGYTSFLNQMELLIWTYKNKGFRNNQMVLQVAHPSDMVLQDPPCLRHIDTRIQDGKLHFFPYFRSWDLWGGFPANLGALQLMKEYIAMEIGVEDGEIIASSKGLHLYKHVFDIAKIISIREEVELNYGSM